MRLGLGNRLGSGNSIISNGLLISGFAYPNETLTAPAGTSYQWYVNDIARVTTQTMTPTVNDIGLVVRCVVDGVECEPVTMWHPNQITAVKHFWWAARNTYNVIGNNFTDETRPVVYNGSITLSVESIGNYSYNSEVNSYVIYKDETFWVLDIYDLTNEDPILIQTVSSDGDGQYPWQTTWPSGTTITPITTTVDTLATDGQTVTAWRDIISGDDATAAGSSIALFEADDLATASLKFDGTDYFTIPFSIRTVFNLQNYGYIFAGVKETDIDELVENSSRGVVSINRTGSFPKIALTTRRSFNNYYEAITGPNSSVLTIASLAPVNEDYNVLTNEAMWADGEIRLRVNGEQSEDVGSFEAVQPNSTVMASYIGAYNNTALNFKGYMTAIILATDLMSDTDRHRIERFIGLLGGLNVRPPNRAYDIDNIVLFEEASDAIPNNWTNSNSAAVASVSFNSTLTSIGSYAFYGCSGLTSVTIPNSVTSLGDYAFDSCTSLTNVTIGSGITSIGNSLFASCTNLTSVTIPNSVTNIGSYAFNYCSGLTSVTIPNSVTSIGSSAFYYCSGLTSVTIPNSVTSIGSYAFYSCSGLTSVTIPNSVTNLGDYAFNNCSGLTSVTISNSLTALADYAFKNCTSLTSVTIPNSVTSIGIAAFNNCSGLTSVTIGSSVTNLGDYAFSNCAGLTSVTIPNSVTSIGIAAFNNCSGLTSVTIGSSVTSIGSYAFYSCSGLTSVTIPNSVTNLGDYAFNNCSGLTSVTIPNSVTSIGEGAFFSCTSLNYIACLATVAPTIGIIVFTSVPANVIHVPIGATGYGVTYGGLTVVKDL